MQLLVWKPAVNIYQLRFCTVRHKLVLGHIIVARKAHIVAVIHNFPDATACTGGCPVVMLVMAFRAGKLIAMGFVMNTFLKFFFYSVELPVFVSWVTTMTINTGHH